MRSLVSCSMLLCFSLALVSNDADARGRRLFRSRQTSCSSYCCPPQWSYPCSPCCLPAPTPCPPLCPAPVPRTRVVTIYLSQLTKEAGYAATDVELHGVYNSTMPDVVSMVGYNPTVRDDDGTVLGRASLTSHPGYPYNVYNRAIIYQNTDPVMDHEAPPGYVDGVFNWNPSVLKYEYPSLMMTLEGGSPNNTLVIFVKSRSHSDPGHPENLFQITRYIIQFTGVDP